MKNSQKFIKIKLTDKLSFAIFKLKHIFFNIFSNLFKFFIVFYAFSIFPQPYDQVQ